MAISPTDFNWSLKQLGDLKNPNLFQAQLITKELTDEESKLLSMVAYRVNMKASRLGSTIQIWYYLDLGGKVKSLIDKAVNDDELELKLTEYTPDGDVLAEESALNVELVESETEFDWGVTDKIAYLKLTFAC